MKIMRLIGLAVASLCATPAFADGSPWSGWYLGGTAGALMQQGCNTLTAQGEWPSYVPVEAAQLNAIGTGCGNTATGFVGGVTAGANVTAGGLVFGIETDFSGATGTSTYQGSGLLDSGNTATTTETTSMPWLATIRPRVGLPISNNLMVYATGGLAIAQLNSQAQTVYTDGGGAFLDQSSGSASAVVAGWTIGAGAEVALGGGWSMKGEYLYTDLSSVSYNTFFSSSLQPFYTDNVTAMAHVSTLRMGLNYRFGDTQFGESEGARSGSMHSPHDWSGPYGGITLGGAFGQSTAVDTDVGNGFWMAPLVENDTFTAASSGPVGTVEAGYNWQMGSMLAGLEGDVGYLGFNGTASSAFDSETTLSSSGGLAGTIRARVGMTQGRLLAFGTAGLIVADVNATVADPYIDYSGPSSGATFTSHTGAQTGWTIGAGLALALNDEWSLKGEYDYFDLGTTLVSGAMLNPDPPTPAQYYGWQIHNRGSIVKVGLDRKF